MKPWILFGPELTYVLMGAVFFVLSMVSRPNPRRDYPIALILAAVGVAVSFAAVGLQGTLFFQVYRIDLFSQIFKVFLAIGLFLIVCICSNLNGIAPRRHREFYLLLSICTLAMMMLVSGVELLTIYVSLELTSYSLYILVALRRGYEPHMEAGIKYFLVGAATSATMLFGLASLYGATHTTYVTELVRVVPGVFNSPMAFIGLLLTLCGFFFKLAVFPFHVWAPGVYQGAANEVTAYIATATKVAAVAVIMRIVALSAGNISLTYVLIGLSIASMTLGNLVAIVQKDLKRLLAYSAIAHAGYVLIGILSMNRDGYTGAIYYATALLAMNFTAFLVVVKVAGDGENLKISQLAGLHKRSPLLAMALMLSMFSLGGIPPTIGFTGKFMVFIAAIHKGYFFLVFIAMVNVVISLYYYALVVKAAYLIEPEESLPPIHLTLPVKLLTLAMVIVVVAGGIYPRPLYDMAITAAQLLP